jgi:hypothetical protein
VRSQRVMQEEASPAGPPAASPAVVADQTGRLLAERECEWLDPLTADPASFAAVELEVHEQTRRQMDLYAAGLSAKVMTMYCSPRGYTGKARGPEGSGL